ncbi:MAG: hypothetical protein EPO32_11145 [Anaerolineae bacterium]|nr:MAG: hypothetical protein EPO32_11145 [Anaerolineae bacterium]
MSNSQKKKQERDWIGEIGRIHPEFSELSDIKDSESPDFIAKREDIIIGVEVVEYVRGQSKGGSKQRQRAKIWKKISKQVESDFQKSQNSSPLQITVSWNPSTYPSKREIQGATKSIIEFITSQLSSSGHTYPLELDYRGLPESVGKYMRRIEIIKGARNQLLHSVTYTSSGWVSIQLDELQKIVVSKDALLPEYSKKVKDCWLVIVADGTDISSHVDLGNEVQHHRFKTGFKKVLFYNKPDSQVIELLINPNF